MFSVPSGFAGNWEGPTEAFKSEQSECVQGAGEVCPASSGAEDAEIAGKVGTDQAPGSMTLGREPPRHPSPTSLADSGMLDQVGAIWLCLVVSQYRNDSQGRVPPSRQARQSRAITLILRACLLAMPLDLLLL